MSAAMLVSSVVAFAACHVLCVAHSGDKASHFICSDECACLYACRLMFLLNSVVIGL